ncbi:MAG: choice-of-anchor Q domain-containing protein [Chloroflexota bacterium]
MNSHLNSFRTNRTIGQVALLVVCLVGLSLALAPAARAVAPAATFTVNSTLDAVDAFPGDGLCATAAGECTLRAAVMEANALAGNDTIVLPAGTYILTIPGAGEDGAVTGDLDIGHTLRILGDGADTTIVDGNGLVTDDRVFQVLRQVRVRIADVTIRNGRTDQLGGGIRNGGILMLQRVTLSDNTAVGSGGAIFNDNEVTIIDSTLSSNSSDNGLATDRGGAIYSIGGDEYHMATAALINSTVSNNNGGHGGGIYSEYTDFVVVSSTITGNTARRDGGGVYAVWTPLTTANTIWSGNTAQWDSHNCWGTINSLGYNLLENNSNCNFVASTGDQIGTPDAPIDPLLDVLGDNGGSTLTHALLPSSPAIDAGNPEGCYDHRNRRLTTDQRGFSREVDGNGDGDAVCDVGSYESTGPDFALLATPIDQTVCVPADALFDVTVLADAGYQPTVILTAEGVPLGATAFFNPNPVDPPGDSVLTVGNTGGVAAGTYRLTIAGDEVLRSERSASLGHTTVVTLTVDTNFPESPNLLSPDDGATDISRLPTLEWTAVPQIQSYEVEVASDPDFTNVVYHAGTSVTSHTVVDILAAQTSYFWRVRGQNSCGSGSFSSIFSFTTGDGVPGSFLVNSTVDAQDAAPGDGQCATTAGDCTLRAAVQETNALFRADIVIVPSGTYTLTIAGKNEDGAARGDLDVSDILFLYGDGAANTLLQGNGSVTQDRVFHVLDAGQLEIEGFTITGTRTDQFGGAIANSGTVVIDKCSLTGNSAASGGAVYSGGIMKIQDSTLLNNTSGGELTDRGGGIYTIGTQANSTLVNSTISSNSGGHGGGIYSELGVFTIINSTISGNSALRDGGGLYQVFGVLTVQNTLLSDNTANFNGANCSGEVFSAGYNFLANNESCTFTATTGDQVGTPENPIDPLLGPLQDNGGPTFTQALLPGSPAVDGGNPDGCTDDQGNLLNTDQRGFERPQDGDGNGSVICDIGAYEVEAIPATLYCSTPTLAIPDNNPAGITDDLILTDTGSISDLNVSLVASHTWVGDLVFTLTHLDTGTAVTLIDRPGAPPAPSCNGDDIDATLDDEAAGPVEDACSPTPPAISGSFIPNSPLSAFDGEDLSGTWRLTAADLAANDVGTLTQWCLAVER